MSPYLLEGLRVIDTASFIAGPVATTMLADFGAEVIKIEPPSGDAYRHRTGGPGIPESPFNYRWIVDNRTKRALSLDLRRPEGREVLHRLVRRADVFVTNAPMDSRQRLGLRWEDLEPLNSRLIYASITAYGEKGDEAAKTGYDSTALWARTGLMDLVRPDPSAAPSRSLPGMGDHPTGVSLFAAIMTALYRRERTGRGGAVSTSLMANGLWWNAIQVQAALCGAKVKPRPGREDAASALANLYRCGDGRWLMLNVLVEDRDWPALLRALGRPDIGTDARFASIPARRANVRALVGILEEVFAGRALAEWRAALDAEGLTFGFVGTVDDARTDAQMVASGALVPIDDPRAGAAYTVSSPIQIGGQQKVPATFAPAIGEHTVEVLRAAGVADAEIERLLAEGVIVQAGYESL